MRKIFEVITDNYKYGIQCNDSVEAMKWVFENTEERFINSTTEIEECDWDKHHINIDEETIVTLMEVMDSLSHRKPDFFY